ncbi:hypothetical protein MY4824_006037 [Beauveria thailandica]
MTFCKLSRSVLRLYGVACYHPFAEASSRQASSPARVRIDIPLSPTLYGEPYLVADHLCSVTAGFSFKLPLEPLRQDGLGDRRILYLHDELMIAMPHSSCLAHSRFIGQSCPIRSFWSSTSDLGRGVARQRWGGVQLPCFSSAFNCCMLCIVNEHFENEFTRLIKNALLVAMSAALLMQGDYVGANARDRQLRKFGDGGKVQPISNRVTV